MDVVAGASDVSSLLGRLNDIRAATGDVGRVLVYLVSSSVFSLDGARVGRHRAALIQMDDSKNLVIHVQAIDQLVRYILNFWGGCLSHPTHFFIQI